MNNKRIKTNISTKKYIILTIIFIIIEIVVTRLTYVYRNNIFPKMPLGGVARPGLRDYLGMLWFCTPTMILPGVIIFCIYRTRFNARINNHIRYLKALNPNMDFSNLTKKDVGEIDCQIDDLISRKVGLFGKPGLGTVIYIIKQKFDRKQLLEDHKYELMQKFPEMDFDNLSREDKKILDDELDVMIYLNRE